MQRRIIVGVDEAGRGPIAGPVTVAAVALLTANNDGRRASVIEKHLEGVKDSKQLSEKKREYFRSVVEALADTGFLKYAVRSTSAAVIDTKGIVFAIHTSLTAALYELALEPKQTFVKLDGALRAPEQFVHQETIIRGDETELPIMLAGIVAKTTRDRLMRAYAARYPQYGFEIHKGYGTKKHYQAIGSVGVCDLHRRTFIS